MNSQPVLRPDRRGGFGRGLLVAAIFAALGATEAHSTDTSTTVRVATFNTELDRKGPGLLLRDLTRGDSQAETAARIIAHISPDVIALQNIDYDADLHALNAFADLIADFGHTYPHRFALRPNTGRATGLDMDRDGRLGGPGDAQAYGEFAGSSGMAILSTLPVRLDEIRNFSDLLWRDLPDADLPQTASGPFLPDDVLAIQRLSNVAHWSLPLELSDGRVFELLTWHATPPVFDGPEDRNGKRNADELRLWAAYLDGRLGTPPERPFVLAGDANLDPFDGDGRSEVMRDFLARADIQDPEPKSLGAAAVGGDGHEGPAELDTVDWRELGIGALRVDYVLPSTDWTIVDAGTFWPARDDPLSELLGEEANDASRHRLVWVDLYLPPDP